MVAKHGKVVLRCLGEALLSKGPRGLLGIMPFGEVLYDVGMDCFQRIRVEWKELEKASEARGEKPDTPEQELEVIAQSPLEEIRSQVREIYADIKSGANSELAAQLADPLLEKKFTSYMEQIPAAIRSTFRRPADPTGKSIPRNFSLRQPEDLQRLLPASHPGSRPAIRSLAPTP